MSGTYCKLSSGIIMSSIWNEPCSVRVVWITMLALKDREGFVAGDHRTIARLANVTVTEAQEAIDLFQTPDPVSRTPDHDGRRIAPTSGGWFVLNHSKYQELGMSEENREKWRIKKQAQRMSPNVPVCPGTNGDTHRSVSTSPSVVVSPEEGCGENGPELPFASTAFAEAWASWVSYRSATRHALKPPTVKAQLLKLARMGEQQAISAIHQSIEQGWQGLFEARPGKLLKGESKELQETLEVPTL